MLTLDWRDLRKMGNWWVWWTKWWVWSATAVLVIMVLSEPPRLWFWLVLFVVILLYGFERSLNS